MELGQNHCVPEELATPLVCKFISKDKESCYSFGPGRIVVLPTLKLGLPIRPLVLPLQFLHFYTFKYIIFVELGCLRIYA